MTFFQVRFYEPNGDYKCTILLFKESDLVNACESFIAFKSGYYANGNGRNVVWDSIHALNLGKNDYFSIPQDLDKLMVWLGPIKQKNLGL